MKYWFSFKTKDKAGLQLITMRVCDKNARNAEDKIRKATGVPCDKLVLTDVSEVRPQLIFR